MYIRCLDGLRAFAILLVLLAHLKHSSPPYWLKNISAYWNAGTVGVRLFFLISGFLITTILNNEIKKNGKINFKRFFMRRLLRIFPAFYFYLLTLSLLSYLGIISIDSLAIFFALFYVQNLNVFQNDELFTSSWLVQHSWSLSVEEQFYVVFPFLLKKLKGVLQNHLFMTMVVITLICSFFRALNYSFPEVSRMTGGVFFMHCDFLVYGGVLALFITQYRDYLTEKLFSFRYYLLIIAIIVLVFASRYEYHSVVNIIISGNLILFANLYILLFFLLFPNSTIGNILEYEIVKSIGKLSYSLYIWQQLFLGSTELWIEYGVLTLFPYNIPIIFICAVCSYYFIEKPFLRLKKAYS